MTNTAALMLYRVSRARPNHWPFPLNEQRWRNSFASPWRLLILCEPLSVVVAYEQRRGHIYGLPESDDPLQRREPFEAFCANWLELWEWVTEARRREIYPEKTHVICMDRTGYPPRINPFEFETGLADVKAMIDDQDRDGLMNDNRISPYVQWMRVHREIFEFVDGVGRYGSGWWLGAID